MKVLMLCLGNICRSPMAQGILEEKLKNTEHSVRVDSAGTDDYHKGEQPDRRAQSQMLSKGIDISDQRSRPLQVSDFDHFDMILCMSEDNLKNASKIARDQKDRDKMKLILNYHPDTHLSSVPDPYFNDRFGEVYDLLDVAIDNFLAEHV